MSDYLLKLVVRDLCTYTRLRNSTALFCIIECKKRIAIYIRNTVLSVIFVKCFNFKLATAVYQY